MKSSNSGPLPHGGKRLHAPPGQHAHRIPWLLNCLINVKGLSGSAISGTPFTTMLYAMIGGMRYEL